MDLPEWYGSRMEGGASERRSSRSMPVRRALASIGEALAVELSGANRTDSWLCAIDPRVKLAGILVLIFAVTLLHGLPTLGALLALTLALAASCRISPARLGRLWLGVPLFSGAIVLPAILNIVTPGASVLTLYRFGEGAALWGWDLPTALTVTRPGLIIAARLIMRSTECITLIAVLTASTDASTLVNALRRLGMPKVFGMTLAMMQRYIATILRAAEEIHLAKLSRSIETTSLRGEQRWVAAGMASLFGRAYRLSEEIRLAMVSRGYDGDLRMEPLRRPRRRDWAWGVGVLLVTLGALWADRLL